MNPKAIDDLQHHIRNGLLKLTQVFRPCDEDEFFKILIHLEGVVEGLSQLRCGVCRNFSGENGSELVKLLTTARHQILNLERKVLSPSFYTNETVSGEFGKLYETVSLIKQKILLNGEIPEL